MFSRAARQTAHILLYAALGSLKGCPRLALRERGSRCRLHEHNTPCAKSAHTAPLRMQAGGRGQGEGRASGRAAAATRTGTRPAGAGRGGAKEPGCTGRRARHLGRATGRGRGGARAGWSSQAPDAGGAASAPHHEAAAARPQPARRQRRLRQPRPAAGTARGYALFPRFARKTTTLHQRANHRAATTAAAAMTPSPRLESLPVAHATHAARE